MSRGERKSGYFTKVHELFRSHSKVFLVGVDNVGSSQMHQIRAAIRGKATLLMGKNTMIKKAMRDILEEVPQIESLIPYIKGNVGLVFTNGDLKDVRDALVSNKVPAAAKVGAIAQCDVTIPAGNTGISPDKTSFFQALGIPTKVVKGAVEILNDVTVIKQNEKVGASEAELLVMLNIQPFQYGCVVELCYDNGAIFEPSVLDITDEAVMKNYSAVLRQVAALSLALGFPTKASVPHSLINGFKNLLATSIASDYTFPASEKLKEALENAKNVAAAAPVTSAAAPTAASAVPAAKEEESGFGLFD
jgi:large subunit ribosomal protein LP0